MASAYDVMAPFHASRAERDAALAKLRRDDPVHWDPVNQWWLVTRHADVREISRKPELFSSEPLGPWHVFEYHFSMQAMDGERHHRNRNVVSRAFTPRLVAMLTERAERYADEAIDALAGRRSAEFVSNLAVPVPLRIIADMLGVADSDLEQFRKWSDAMIDAGGGHAEDGTLGDTQRMLGDFLVYLTEAVVRRRAEPSDDILSRIVEAGDAGVLDDAQRLHRLEGDEVRDFALFEHPEERARLSSNAAAWETAPDEILRWTSPVRAMRRVALRDTSLHDRKILEGQSVVMVYASANRDEAVFDEPHRFRVDRDPNEHLAFGFGPHYCLGANLARMEIRTVLRKILQRLPEIRLAEGAKPLQTQSALIDGLDELPVEW